MSDRYLAFANSSTGRRLVGALGLPAPVRLERWMAGRVRPIDGALLPHWIGALAIRAGSGWLDPALAARLPFAALLVLTLAAGTPLPQGLLQADCRCAARSAE